MATYTAFVSSPKVAAPQMSEDGTTWRYFAYADVIVLDANSVPVAPWGMTEAWAAFATVPTSAPILASDTVATIRQKVAGGVRANWVPTITESDTLRLVFLDSGSLLNL